MRIRPPVAFFFIACLLAACGPSHPLYLKKDHGPFPTRVAVLPMNNMTTDLDGPQVVRGFAQRLMEMSGYETIPMEETDTKLREQLGITDGGQLPSVTYRKLGEVLGVDGLIFGDLEDFNYINVGFFQNRIVEARFWFIDVSADDKLWEDQYKVVNPSFETNLDDAKRALVIGTGEKWAERALRSPLALESAVMVNEAFSTFPKRVEARLPIVTPLRIERSIRYKKKW